MTLVINLPRSRSPQQPDRRDILRAAGIAAVAVCEKDWEAVGNPALETGHTPASVALATWLEHGMRKIARRARGSAWERALALPGHTTIIPAPTGPDKPQEGQDVPPGGVGTQPAAQVHATLPHPVAQTPAALGCLQIDGTDLPVGPQPAAPVTPRGDATVRHDPGAEGLADSSLRVEVLIDAGLGMSMGKAAAQVGHATMVLARALDPETRQRWAAQGYALDVREVEADDFAAAVAEADRAVAAGRGRHDHRLLHVEEAGVASIRVTVGIHDAGYTEVAPGSMTVLGRCEVLRGS